MNALTLIKNATLYAPEFLGQQDILLAGGKVVQIAAHIETGSVPCTVIDAKGKIATPGLIDQHIHLIGGGGEGGFATRTPAVTFGKLVQAGLTTVVGVMGTDGSTRSPRDLYAKAMGLRAEGLSVYMHTGSYQLPTVTVTGSVRDDLILLAPVLGVKLAVADHRGSFPTAQEMLRLVSDVRMGGMLAGKRGVLHMHMGGLDAPFAEINAALAAGIPAHHFSPTHVARTRELMDDAIAFCAQGGYIDITSAGSCAFASPADAVLYALEAGAVPERLTVSSDGNGSLPVFNAQGEMERITAADVSGNLDLLVELVRRDVPITTALRLMTSNVADSLGLRKGRLATGEDADVCLFNPDFSLDTLIAGGQVLLQHGEMQVTANFE